MRRSDWLTALVASTAALFLVPFAAVASPSDVEVCHRSAPAAPDDHQWVRLRVSDRSLERHLDHGDALPGEEVPDSNGDWRFDADCTPQPTDQSGLPESPPEPEPPVAPTPVVFAIAYSDTDASGDYGEAVDVLIAKLVDGPGSAGDGSLGPGDLIIAERYPLDFALTGFGSFASTEHIVTDVSVVNSYVCHVISGDGMFVWSDGQGDFDLYQEWTSGAPITRIHDRRTEAPILDDEIRLVPVSPSQPADSLTLLGPADPIDHTFLEIEVDCLP